MLVFRYDPYSLSPKELQPSFTRILIVHGKLNSSTSVGKFDIMETKGSCLGYFD